MPGPPKGAPPEAPVVVVLKFITPADTPCMNLSKSFLLSDTNPAESPKDVLLAPVSYTHLTLPTILLV